MSLNCRAGDLAVVTWSMAGNEGRVVTCIRLATTAEMDEVCLASLCRPAWVTDTALNGVGGVFDRVFLAADRALKPIRDQDGEDETLNWAGKPEQVAA